MSRFYLSRRDPKPKTFQELAIRWCDGRSTRLIAVIWAGIDLLMNVHFSEVPIQETDEVIEETINFLLAITIASCLEPYSRSLSQENARSKLPGRVNAGNLRALTSVS